MLTESELDAFWEDGFLAIEGVFAGPELDALRALAEHPAIVEALRVRRAHARTVHLIELTTMLEGFRDLAREPRITDRVAALIGDDLQLQHSKLATKPLLPGVGEFAWHQDFAYFPHTNFDLVSVAINLDDTSPRNGGMLAVRGSHRLGVLDHSRGEWMVGACVEPRHWEADPERVVPLATAAGGITLHHCLTLHGSPANASGRARRCVVFQYRAGDAYQLADHTWEDTGYQVHGTPSRRVRCVPLDMVLPKNEGWQRHCGEPHGSVYRQLGAHARRWNQEPNA